MTQTELTKVYHSVTRAIIEFCAPVYSGMLTGEQVNRLEKMQEKCLKIIYGHELCYEKLLEKSGLDTLQVRRKTLCVNFAKKCADYARFASWFPPHSYNCDMVLRSRPTFQENLATTNRRYNSPVYYLRRLLNEDCAQNPRVPEGVPP